MYIKSPTNSITFDSVTCSSNTAATNGGCVYYIEDLNTVDTSVTINIASGGTSTWNSNLASNQGGIFYISSMKSITVTVTSSTMSSNTATITGGGFYFNTNG